MAEKENSNTDSYLPDRPIEEEKQDRFKRSYFAKRIADSISSRTDTSGLVIGLYGQWGDGKTSTLNLMASDLEKYPDIVVTRFNPWFFQSEHMLIEGFFEHLAKEVGKVMVTAGQDFAESVRKYGSLLSIVASSVTIGGVSINFDAMTKAAKAFQKNPTPVELRDRISDILKNSGKHIVVLIDDIDRLDKEEVHQIFKLVKLSGNFENTTYVLAFDKEMVAAALAEKYASSTKDKAGTQFLEKIIQVPLHLPTVERQLLHRTFYKDLDVLLKALEAEATQADAFSFAQEFPTSIGHALQTPRQITRYINAIAFALPLLKDEVNIRDLLFIEGLRVFYPNIYAAVRDNADLLLNGFGIRAREKEAQNFVKGIIEQLPTPEEKKGIEGLLEKLFPHTGSASYGDDWETKWAREKRVCSHAYFQRYFSYAIPFYDISDVSFQDFVGELGRMKSTAEICTRAKKYAETNDLKAIVPKARHYEDTIDLSTGQKLAIGIVANGDLLPPDNDPFFSTASQAIYYMMKIMTRTPKIGRDKFAKQILENARPTLFAVRCFMHLQRDEKETKEHLIAKESEQQLGKALAKRVRSDFESNPQYLNGREGVINAFWIWNSFSRKGELGRHLTQRLEAYPDEVAQLLATLTGTAYGGYGPPHMSDFDGRSYEELAKIVDVEKIQETIDKSKYKANLDPKKNNRWDGIDEYQRVVNQFVATHESKLKSASTALEAPTSLSEV